MTDCEVDETKIICRTLIELSFLGMKKTCFSQNQKALEQLDSDECKIHWGNAPRQLLMPAPNQRIILAIYTA